MCTNMYTFWKISTFTILLIAFFSVTCIYAFQTFAEFLSCNSDFVLDIKRSLCKSKSVILRSWECWNVHTNSKNYSNGSYILSNDSTGHFTSIITFRSQRNLLKEEETEFYILRAVVVSIYVFNIEMITYRANEYWVNTKGTILPTGFWKREKYSSPGMAGKGIDFRVYWDGHSSCSTPCIFCSTDPPLSLSLQIG